MTSLLLAGDLSHREDAASRRTMRTVQTILDETGGEVVVRWPAGTSWFSRPWWEQEIDIVDQVVLLDPTAPETHRLRSEAARLDVRVIEVSSLEIAAAA